MGEMKNLSIFKKIGLAGILPLVIGMIIPENLYGDLVPANSLSRLIFLLVIVVGAITAALTAACIIMAALDKAINVR
ncbi:hypothetical protein A3C91_03410 [Candidatus Azambacteria bacterium RIFCSPHIGHO2_02_FULL_52_12]|uniref:Uncharacterized protein n=1 Tax=Candidatus Azambacteria bacterium RIFCSPLOWO2_01_FULL_46_25 TaxID=1797298 RepID=A0A1F5BW18_9BACT|nr:MAG: hypothetical protein A3C91_03410 [Candidatus Azambacteria bacterium RIFCSPHIGHO2_02_FULL_52_12]OGD34807.1 MAG: hypothetical protein A2988_04930 [Candidatus Azambacteria bacterium RIFCSPLOWO2_01_FULL_46_25]